MTPKLTRVIRLDGLPLDQTYFTEEGYLIDRPILTSTGIFEYHNPDGSIRRELRLPEEVFHPDSLKSFKGKPVIITHDAGLVTSDNVREHQIGTVLTEGYRSNNDVRAEIVIHDTDAMKESKLKELSLGYNLELDETPGEWNGQHYDAIQRGIRINHLALVREARAGEQARLNIDGRDSEKTLKGGKAMSKKTEKAPAKAHRTDGALPPDELAKAIEEYKAKRAKSLADKEDSAVEPTEETAVGTEEVKEDEGASEVKSPEEQVQLVKDRRDRKCDGEDEPMNLDEAKEIIAQQDEDIKVLLDAIDEMQAKADFDSEDDPELTEDCGNKDEDDVVEEPEVNEDEDDVDVVTEEDEEEDLDKEDSDDSAIPDTNASEVGKSVLTVDSVDEIIRQRIELGTVGRKLNMDGLEKLSIKDAKKAIINAVRPGMRLDGKSEAYINAAYDMAMDEAENRSTKDTGYQKRQMFNKDSRKSEEDVDSSVNARQRMIDRQMNKKEEK